MSNIFIIAACNPHRGDSLAINTSDKSEKVSVLSGDISTFVHQPDTVVSSDSYYVRKLHPTLSLIKWDYGSLNKEEERDYVRAKFIMLQRELSNPIEDTYQEVLTDLIVCSQEAMREYMKEELIKKYEKKEAITRSGCCVSQRDIQRVIKFYRWLLKAYQYDHVCKSQEHRHALMVSLGLVYYMRLPIKYRKKYVKHIDHQNRKLGWEITFGEALSKQLDWYVKSENLDLPSGIAKTEALKENLLAIILCCVTRTPLIIEGAPGTSKTLSFNVAVTNLKGKGSKKSIFQKDNLYPSLEPQFYQCSRRTTSQEIKVVFNRAIKVQKRKDNAHSISVVFMDEAGLPERAHESLKILHYYLENPIVSFVAITNHPLDAAKTNRAVSVYRPETSSASKEDLDVLARDCLGINSTPKITKFCTAYMKIMEVSSFCKFYGLRDFIYFLIHLRHKINPDLDSPDFSLSERREILYSLQRNFGGKDPSTFKDVCKYFTESVSMMGCSNISYYS